MQNFNYNQNNLRKSLPKLFVLGLIMAALVPYGWATQYSSKAYYVVNYLLGGEMAHVVGHFLLFFVLGTAVIAIFPRLKNHPTLYFGLMFIIGLLQEFLQLATFKMRGFAFAEVFDLTIDLLGAALAFVLMRKINRRLEIREFNLQSPISSLRQEDS